MARKEIVEYYRKHDDFTRYAGENDDRTEKLTSLYNSCSEYFGKRILDIACGGGALGFILEPKGRTYVGIDLNPDMVSLARRHARAIGSKNVFILGDAGSKKIEGKFDTVSLLGNALMHFDAGDFSKVIRNINRNSHRGSYFLVEYRDVVHSLFDGHFRGRHEDNRNGKKTISLPKGIDTERGKILIESLVDEKHNLNFGHAIWSPFIISTIMGDHGWEPRKRIKRHDYILLDVYQRS